MKKLGFFIFLIACFFVFDTPSLSGQPQNPEREGAPLSGNITGKILEAGSKVPLEFATIAVYKEIDSSLVTGGIADNRGNFNVSPVPPGKYYIEIRFMGYENYHKDGLEITRNNSNVDLGVLHLSPVAENISEVTVTTQSKAIAYEIDKKVLDPSFFPTSASGTAIDVLANSPSVTVDIEGNVSLRGSSSFTVLIDGRPTPFSAADALEQIPASMIRNIEIITNPSAKFDPDGNAGIVNINTKRSRLEGVSGIANSSADSRGSLSGDILLNYRTGRFNFYVSANTSDRMGSGTSEAATMTMDSIISNTRSFGEGGRGGKSYSLKSGFDYYINNYNTLTFNVDVNSRSRYYKSSVFFEESNSTGFFLESFTDNNNTRSGKEMALSLDYKKTFKQEGRELTGFIYFEKEKDNEYSWYYQYDGDDILINGLRSWEVGSGGTDFRAKIDYIHPFSGKKKLETGMQTRISREPEWNDVHWFSSLPNDYKPSPSSPYYSDTDFSRDIHSLYGIFSNSNTLWGYQLGMRTEYTHRTMTYSGSEEDYVVNRLDFFPTTHVSLNLPHDQQMIASYTRRIERPRGYSLEPFITYENAYSVRRGNPSILPEYIDSYELGYQKQIKDGFISAELYFRQTNNKTERVQSVYEPNVIMRSVANVGTDYSLGTELMFNYKPFRWWMLNLMGNIYNYRLEGEFSDLKISTSSNNWSSRFNNTFMPWKNTRLQVNVMYNSPTVTLQGRREGFTYTNLAIRQDFLNNKLSATFGIRDVLNTAKFEYISEGPDFSSYRKFDLDSPIFSFSLSFRINDFKPQRQQNGNGEGMMDMEGDGIE